MNTEQIDKIKKLVLIDKRNVFFTGPAGTGKSTLLKSLVQSLERTGRRVAVTASTGIAASHINGTTLHRFIGCGLATNPTDVMVKSILDRLTSRERWQAVETLVVVEISMINAELFDKVEEIARLVRDDKRPFGGIQLIVVGDFLQLPPVKGKACFLANTWCEVIDEIVHLDQVFRQTHPVFVAVLQRLRLGEATEKDHSWINKNLTRKITPPKGVIPTYTVCTNDEADVFNTQFIQRLPKTTRVVYKSTDRFFTSEITVKDINCECTMREELELRLGAKVMLTYNYSDVLVNGSIGYVTEFMHEFVPARPVVKFECGLEMCVHPRKWYLHRLMDTHQLRTTVIEDEEEEDRVTRRSQVIASRRQIPLRLAWAITIHKSQGQTLEWHVALVNNIFAKGQLYTAMSRANDPDKLEVRGYTGKINKICQETNDYYFGKR